MLVLFHLLTIMYFITSNKNDILVTQIRVAIVIFFCISSRHFKMKIYRKQ